MSGIRLAMGANTIGTIYFKLQYSLLVDCYYCHALGFLCCWLVVTTNFETHANCVRVPSLDYGQELCWCCNSSSINWAGSFIFLTCRKSWLFIRTGGEGGFANWKFGAAVKIVRSWLLTSLFWLAHASHASQWFAASGTAKSAQWPRWFTFSRLALDIG